MCSMAKKQTTPWHKKHIPTKWGVAVLSLLLLATVILIPTLTQRQVSESDAASANTTTRQTVCISYDTSGHCHYYQTTVTTVNTSKPCLSRNNVGKCTYYAGTQVGVTGSPNKPKTTTQSSVKKPSGSGSKPANPVVLSTTGPGYLVCINGQAVYVGGGAYKESRTELAHICSLNPNNVFLNGQRYSCSNLNAVPSVDRAWAKSACNKFQ